MKVNNPATLCFSWTEKTVKKYKIKINDIPESGVDVCFNSKSGDPIAFGVLCILHAKPYILWEDGVFSDLTIIDNLELLSRTSI